MITGAHSIIYSTNPEKDRDFIREVLKFPSIDAGGGWLIFGLPPAEVAVHPSKKNNVHEFYLMCDDIENLIREMRSANVKCSKVQQAPWGLLTKLKLPGGGDLGVYQPLHPRPRSARIKASTVPRSP
jgi:hypothetical protein